MRHIVRLDGQDYGVALAGPADRRAVLVDDMRANAALQHGAGSAAMLTLNGQRTDLHIAGTDEALFVWVDGDVYNVAVLEPLAVHARQAGATAGLEARAPMPGSVVSLPVAVGDTVQPGDTLVIIESMKLEVALKATSAGVVAEILCAPGGSFDKDAVLVRLLGIEA